MTINHTAINRCNGEYFIRPFARYRITATTSSIILLSLPSPERLPELRDSLGPSALSPLSHGSPGIARPSGFAASGLLTKWSQHPHGPCFAAPTAPAQRRR